MRFLVVGLGSMGKRRIRNLQHLQAGEIIGFDPQEERRAEAQEKYGIATFGGFEDAIREEPGALIISTPPDLHMEYARRAAQAGLHFFCEASVTEEGMAEVSELVQRAGVVGAPSCTLRFHPLVQRMKGIIEGGGIGQVLTFTHHSGQYLPDWHPWEDYRRFYAAKRETGACREIVPFELTWLTWLLGDVTRVSCLRGKLSGLEVDIDDVYHLLIQCGDSVIGHLLVDVVARAATRVCRILGETGVIEWVASEKRLRVYDAEAKTWAVVEEPPGVTEAGYLYAETMYIHEMKAFLSAVRGEEPFPNCLDDDLRVLRVLYAAEESSDSGRHVTLR